MVQNEDGVEITLGLGRFAVGDLQRLFHHLQEDVRLELSPSLQMGTCVFK